MNVSVNFYQILQGVFLDTKVTKVFVFLKASVHLKLSKTIKKSKELINT